MTRPKRNAPSDPDSRRVIRGGSWSYTDPAWVRASYRDAVAPTIRVNVLGFRTALTGRQPR